MYDQPNFNKKDKLSDDTSEDDIGYVWLTSGSYSGNRLKLSKKNLLVTQILPGNFLKKGVLKCRGEIF
jgi:hypothetical protein